MRPASVILAASRVVTRDRVLTPGRVTVTGSTIEAVQAVPVGTPPGTPEAGALDDATYPVGHTGTVPVVLDLGDVTLVPGFVDLHCHGGGGASFDEAGREGLDDEASSEATAAVIRRIRETHLVRGVTSVMASLVTAPVADLERQVTVLAPYVDRDDLLGIHLEGPWLASAYRGAHPAGLLRSPDDVAPFLAAGAGTIRMVTLAPELPGGLAAVTRLADAEVLPAIGHTAASYDVTIAAIDAGARVATHLFNAMRPLQHRDPGPVAALLERPEVTVELIADGVHVHPAMLRLAGACAGPGRVALVTDAMAAAGTTPLGGSPFQLGGEDVLVDGGVARRPDGSLAGSTLTLDAALRYAVRVLGWPRPDAVRAASTVPAAALGRDEIGALAPGRRADLVVLDGDLNVTGVMRAGTWVRLPPQGRPDRPIAAR